jgi:hypothetical protein
MKMIDFIENIQAINDDLIIFQEVKNDFNSDIILINKESSKDWIKKENDKQYHYLIEVFLAKEFVEDFIKGSEHTRDKNEVAKRLYEYAINDA